MVVSLSQARRVRCTGQQKLEPTTVTWSEVSMFFVSFFPNESRTNAIVWMVQTFVFPHNFPISQAEGSHKSLLSGRVRGHWTIFKSSHRVTTQVNKYDWETWDGTFLGIFCGISSKSVFLTFLRNSLTGQKVTNLSKGRIHTALCPIPGKWLPLTREEESLLVPTQVFWASVLARTQSVPWQ